MGIMKLLFVLALFGVVLYKESKAVHARARRVIFAGMRQWTRGTCVRFRRRRRERAYVRFIRGSDCSSYVGRVGRRQDVSLHIDCWTTGTVAHEIGHALGFWHEQSRPDRDRYVRILWQNIQRGEKHNFRKRRRSESSSLGVRYDYRSVMHYSPKAFSKNGRPTIRAKRRGGLGTLNQPVDCCSEQNRME
nr:zinc metalloproteinase nas-6-like [Pocillopora verrucosa]